jgi:hypothetical protein
VGALPVERGAVQGALRLTPRADAGGGQPAVDFGEQFFHGSVGVKVGESKAAGNPAGGLHPFPALGAGVLVGKAAVQMVANSPLTADVGDGGGKAHFAPPSRSGLNPPTKNVHFPVSGCSAISHPWQAMIALKLPFHLARFTVILFPQLGQSAASMFATATSALSV